MSIKGSVVGNARIRNELEEYIAELDGENMMYDENITGIFKKERFLIHHIVLPVKETGE